FTECAARKSVRIASASLGCASSVSRLASIMRSWSSSSCTKVARSRALRSSGDMPCGTVQSHHSSCSCSTSRRSVPAYLGADERRQLGAEAVQLACSSFRLLRCREVLLRRLLYRADGLFDLPHARRLLTCRRGDLRSSL